MKRSISTSVTNIHLGILHIFYNVSLAVTWRKNGCDSGQERLWIRESVKITEENSVSKFAKHYLHLGLDPGSNDIGLCTKLFTKPFILLLASVFFHQGLIPSGNQLPHLQWTVTQCALQTHKGTCTGNAEVATREGGVGICTEYKQSYGSSHSGQAHRMWILSAVGYTNSCQVMEEQKQLRFHSLFGFLVAHVNRVAGFYSDLTLVILFVSKNHKHNGYGQ